MSVPGKCIFCGGKGLTKEHLFPQWMRPLLQGYVEASELPSYAQLRTFGGLSVPGLPSANGWNNQGYIFNKRLRVVCRSCNNGWMSQQEQATKSLLTAMIEGRPAPLGQDEQFQLALWCALRAAIFERDDPKNAAISRYQYRYIYEHRTLPDGWKVFAASYSGLEWAARMFHLSGKVLNINDQSMPSAPNTHLTAIGMGKTICVVLGSTATNASFVTTRLSPTGLEQIWPFVQALEWPVAPEIGDEALGQIAYGTPYFM
ncbi:hypothetical protein [Rhizobium leguminosarum]|uniref:hypothetical protein n=1 Tax=Rhizobium leguminosarum TaxID=384 RepID=UPI003D6EEF60